MRILIADDDVTSRLVLEATATKLGHECVVAKDGSSAWSHMASEAIDVLLTDWMMPGLDGVELCRRVRRDLAGRYVYIVLVTGLAHPEDVLEGMGAGADDYLVKPVDPFAVQARLVAAERVTSLHRQVSHFRDELERANVELRQLSLTDALTGVGNRRRMEEELRRVHARADRTGRPYSVALFDIDHFKRYNDHHGHMAGDQALRQIAGCFDRTTRSGESVYRYGGEEFLLLLEDCSPDGALTAAERVREEVEAAALPHLARPSGPAFITVSGGVASWSPLIAASMADVVERADAALFKAKAAGGNRVHVADEARWHEALTTRRAR